MAKIKVRYLNEVHLYVECNEDVAYELNEAFSFKIPGARFNPKVQNKMWDGVIKLFNIKKRTIYAGLREDIQTFAINNGYEYEEEDVFASDPFSVYEAKEFITKLAPTMEPRDYQIESFVKAVRDRRKIFLSPTNSGKSFFIYLTLQYLQKKSLIIVPRTSLVGQMTTDFMDYDNTKTIASEVHPIFSGAKKDTDKRITISTWQSIYKHPKEWFNQFETIIGDEVHNFKAKSLVTLMEKTPTCYYKIGCTGTLDGSMTNEMVLKGLFGPTDQVTTNAELIKRKISAELKIKSIILDYPEDIKKSLVKTTYQDEVDFLVQLKSRNNFIANLAHSLDGNVMILFRFVDKQGYHLQQLLEKKNKDRSGIYYIYGGVDVDYRNQVRKIVDTQNRAIINASVGTFSEGINIKNINYIIFASPSKSRVKVLQSIGRGLRVSDTKDEVTLFDIADDLSWKSKKNHTLLHYAERVKMYNQEKFNYKQYRIGITT